MNTRWASLFVKITPILMAFGIGSARWMDFIAGIGVTGYGIGSIGLGSVLNEVITRRENPFAFWFTTIAMIGTGIVILLLAILFQP